MSPVESHIGWASDLLDASIPDIYPKNGENEASDVYSSPSNEYPDDEEKGTDDYLDNSIPAGHPDAEGKKGLTENIHPLPTSHYISWLGGWWTEIIIWLFSAVCVLFIAVILGVCDDKPAPTWRYGVTLNTLISIFTTMARVAMLIPTAEAISQFKWLWFAGRKRKLRDFDRFDRASRGIWGSICLLATPRYWSPVCLGAFLIIAGLAIDPLTQQTVGYPLRLFPSSGGLAILNRTESIQDDILEDPFHDLLGLASQGAIYDGLSSSELISPVLPYCSSGNCSWPIYSTLGICASFANVTDYAEVTCSEIGSVNVCNMSIPGAFNVSFPLGALQLVSTNKTGPSGLNSTGFTAFGDIPTAIANFYTVLPSRGLHELSASNQSTSMQAINQTTVFESILYPCVKTFSTQYVNGTQVTSTLDWYTNFSQVTSDRVIPIYGGTMNYSSLIASPPSSFVDGGRPYNMSMGVFYGFQAFTPTIFAGDSQAYEDGAMSNYSTIAVQAIYNAVTQPPYDIAASLGFVLENVATSMTNFIVTRNTTNQPLEGTAYVPTTFVQIRWSWFVAICLLDAASLVYLLYAIVRSGRKGASPWKSSSLAALHGLWLPNNGFAPGGDDEADAQASQLGLCKTRDLESRADETWVTLAVRDGRTELVVVSAV